MVLCGQWILRIEWRWRLWQGTSCLRQPLVQPSCYSCTHTHIEWYTWSHFWSGILSPCMTRRTRLTGYQVHNATVMCLNGIHYRVVSLYGLIQKWLLNQQNVSIMLFIQNHYSIYSTCKECLWLASECHVGYKYATCHISFVWPRSAGIMIERKGYSLLYDSI